MSGRGLPVGTHRDASAAQRRATPEQHVQASYSMRDMAEHCLATGNLPLASEAYWGMVAHMLQAIAEKRDMRHDTNLDFRTIKDWLTDETQNTELNHLFIETYELHRNFYRIVMTRDEVVERSRFAVALADTARPFA